MGFNTVITVNSHIPLEMETQVVMVLIPFQHLQVSHILLSHPPKSLHKAGLCQSNKTFHHRSSSHLATSPRTSFHWLQEKLVKKKKISIRHIGAQMFSICNYGKKYSLTKSNNSSAVILMVQPLSFINISVFVVHPSPAIVLVICPLPLIHC